MFFTATFQYLLSCNTRHGRGFRTVECICKGIVKYKACDFPRVIQAIRMQKKKKKAICLLKILTLQSACPQKIGNRVEIES